MANITTEPAVTESGTAYEILLETEPRRATWEGVRAMYPACHASIRFGGRVRYVGKACRPDAVSHMRARARERAEAMDREPAPEPVIDLAAWK